MTQIWAHRGASADAPENTLPAFEMALAQRADGVELDVQLTADGAPVVIHDETLERTTNGVGGVADHTLAQLQALDASAGRPGFAGVRIPTLAEVFSLLAPAGITINVELKNSVVPYEGLEQKVLAMVAEFGLAQQVVLSTFNHYSLRRLRAVAAGSELAALYTDPLFRPWRYAAQLGVTAIHPPVMYVFGRRYVARSHSAGIAVRPWVVDGERSLMRMFGYGVDAVFTNTVAAAVELRDRATPPG